MKLVFATNNQHKLQEVQELLTDKIKLVTLKEIGCLEDIEETADTLEGNAQIKSDHIRSRYGFNCFADDTGLEVEALGGAPGVYSARYAGENATFQDNVEKLLLALDGESNRNARFRTVISLILDGKQFFFEGICEGIIEETATGKKGFGYDPIFKPLGFDKTFAQMNMEEKGRISHRGLAVQKLVNYLKEQF